MALGDRIRQRRDDTGLSAAELARRAGISKGYLSEIESGNTVRPSADVLYRLATALGTTIADLLDREIPAAAARIPPSLQAFAESRRLPDEDLHMLAQICFRGEQPSTADDWWLLYEAIQRSLWRPSC